MKQWTEKRNCELHGEYEGKFYILTDEGNPLGGHCPACTNEKREKEELHEKQIKDTRLARHLESVRFKAGVSKRNMYKTFDDYICKSDGQAKAKKTCVDYAKEFPTSRNLIFTGSVGTGKTLLACSIIEELVNKHTCQMIKAIDLIRELKTTWSRDCKHTEKSVIEYFAELDLLIIDEIGVQFGSDTEKMFIFDIIDARYQNVKPIILISNLDVKGIEETIGARCLDRLREDGGIMVAFDWESSRAQN